ncbi:hypothetical protein ACVBGC_26315 [Burkholderia stagnalis]
MKLPMADRSRWMNSSVRQSRRRGFRRFEWGVIGAIALLACACSAGEASEVWPDGVIGHTCGSNDASVPVIVSVNGGTSVRLSGPDADVDARSAFPRSDLGKDGVDLCDSRGCEPGAEASFKVRAVGSDAWQVDFKATFERAGRPRVIRGSFIARRSAGGPSMPCG